MHLTQYEDATVVCTNIPHAIVDQLGFSSFVRAWLQVARGEKPAQFLQLERGALDGPKDISEEELQRKATYRVTTAKERAGILLGFVPELILQPSETRRLLVFPEALIANLREKHQAKIASTHGAKLQVTNGDIVAALLLKVRPMISTRVTITMLMIFQLTHLHRKKPKMIMLTGTVNGKLNGLRYE